MNIFLIDRGLSKDCIYNFICSFEHPSSEKGVTSLRICAEYCAKANCSTYIRQREREQYCWADIRNLNHVENVEECTKIYVSGYLKHENYIGVI